MSRKFQSWCFALAGFVFWTLPCAAQLTLGENLQVGGGGSVSTGYSGTYSDLGGAGNSLNFGGNGNFNGFYYNPNFVGFSISPYYNQSRDNSGYQSTFDSSGVTFSSTILKDTHFPGSISYGKSYNSAGTYGNSALPNFTTNGSNQSFGVGWSALLPGLPSLTATYSTGTSQSTIYGTSGQSSDTSRTYGLRSSYVLRGFDLSANYNNSASGSKTPELLSTQQVIGSTSSSNAYGLSTSHTLPLRGSISSSINRVSYQGIYSGGSNSSTTDYQNASAVFHPLRKMSVTFQETYSDNLAGVINQSILNAGGVPQASSGSGTHNLNLGGGTGYPLFRYFGVTGLVTHVEQSYGGKNYQATYLNGSVHGGYRRKLFGMVTWSVSMVDNATQTGNGSTGMMADANISHKVLGWYLAGSFDYAENIQTLLVMYTSSFTRYSLQASRRFGNRVRWAGQFSTGHSAMNGIGNSGSNNENLSSSLSVRWLTATGTYSKMDGSSIQTTTGLQASPVPTSLLPASQIIGYGGNNYGFSLMGTPISKLSISGTYTRSSSNTLQSLTNSQNQTQGLGGSLQYQLRKLSLRAYYSKASQSISAAGTKPNGVTSYYFGVTRSFRLF